MGGLIITIVSFTDTTLYIDIVQDFGQVSSKRDLPFCDFFLIHLLHVLMFCRNFELVPIKIEYFTNFKVG